MEEKQDDGDDDCDAVYDYRKFDCKPFDADEDVKLFVQKLSWRQQILYETLHRLSRPRVYREVVAAALRNLATRRARVQVNPADEATTAATASSNTTTTTTTTLATISVIQGDWGDVALTCIRRTGQVYAVLNMANALSPGEGYTDGCAAQEANMFRRTTCHFSIHRQGKMNGLELYRHHMISLINGDNGLVNLGGTWTNPRVCVLRFGRKWLSAARHAANGVAARSFRGDVASTSTRRNRIYPRYSMVVSGKRWVDFAQRKSTVVIVTNSFQDNHKPECVHVSDDSAPLEED
eukprot:scaffold4955_cov204-Amphora_coffeaeformis.AAC.1